MLEIIIIKEPIEIEVLKKMSESQFVDFIKAVVDIELKIMAAGGSLHADEEKKLLETGSLQQNLWGINIYFDVDTEDRIEFDSMINIRPYQGNVTRSVDDIEIQNKIIAVTNHLLIL